MDLVTRAKNILTEPTAEWPVIAGETTTTAELFSGYVFPLAAIGPIAAIVGSLLFAGGGLVTTVVLAIVSFGLALVAVYVLAFIAGKIAPSFGGKDDLGQALKLVAYSYTPAWLGGIFNLVSAAAASLALIVLVVTGPYGLYLVYTGASATMSVPKDRSVGYTAVVILVAIGLYIVVALVVGLIVAVFLAAGSAR